MDEKSRDDDREYVTMSFEAAQNDAAEVGRLAREGRVVVVTDSAGEPLLTVSSPLDNWPLSGR